MGWAVDKFHRCNISVCMPISQSSLTHLAVKIAVVRCEDHHGVVQDVLTPQFLQYGPARGVDLRGFEG